MYASPFREFFQGGVCTSTDRIDGKVVVVTGANTGIGKETVVDLVNRGAMGYFTHYLHRARH
jgi:hypothetical protein